MYYNYSLQIAHRALWTKEAVPTYIGPHPSLIVILITQLNFTISNHLSISITIIIIQLYNQCTCYFVPARVIFVCTGL